MSELQEQIHAKRKLLRIHKQRKQHLEEQAATMGLLVSPAILMEITTIEEHIAILEKEIAAIQTDAVVDQFSLVEAEYRVLLADAWDTSSGIPTIASEARLEVARLKFGLHPDQARRLEAEIRDQLAQQVFFGIDIRTIFDTTQILPLTFETNGMVVNIQPYSDGTVHIENLHVLQQGLITSPLEATLKILGKAIRLAPHTSGMLFLRYLPSNPVLDIQTFRLQLFQVNHVDSCSDDHERFEQFMAYVGQHLPINRDTAYHY